MSDKLDCHVSDLQKAAVTQYCALIEMRALTSLQCFCDHHGVAQKLRRRWTLIRPRSALHKGEVLNEEAVAHGVADLSIRQLRRDRMCTVARMPTTSANPKRYNNADVV